MAPLRALCGEKFGEWTEKFEKLHNLKCLQLTGDTDFQVEKDLDLIEKSNIICTTPEKWDFLTRKWKQRRRIIDAVKLFSPTQIKNKRYLRSLATRPTRGSSALKSWQLAITKS